MTIGEQWESFRKEYVPADAGPVQVTETRRAFYAGAAASLAEFTSRSMMALRRPTRMCKARRDASGAARFRGAGGEREGVKGRGRNLVGLFDPGVEGWGWVGKWDPLEGREI